MKKYRTEEIQCIEPFLKKEIFSKTELSSLLDAVFFCANSPERYQGCVTVKSHCTLPHEALQHFRKFLPSNPQSRP
jgi:hypothetical protein